MDAVFYILFLLVLVRVSQDFVDFGAGGCYFVGLCCQGSLILTKVTYLFAIVFTTQTLACTGFVLECPKMWGIEPDGFYRTGRSL